VRIDDRIRKSVLFIGTATTGGLFTPKGTGFVTIFEIGEKVFQTLVTAKHVIDLVPTKEVAIRVNTWQGQARIVRIRKDWWFPHPDPNIDLMVAPTGLSREEFDILHLPINGKYDMTPQPGAAFPAALGDDVFIAGMFVSRMGETKNIPIARFGNISAMPEEKIRTAYGYHDAYLVESRSIDGLSGSPVFVPTPHFVYDGKQVSVNQDFRYTLIGMVLGHPRAHNPDDLVEMPVRGRAKKTKLAPVPLNTGIAVVLPIADIIAAIDQPVIRKNREEALRQEAKDRTFKADGAAESEPPTTADNPSHREDFTSLLRAAATRKPSKGRT
jgi:hypothetical protein